MEDRGPMIMALLILGIAERKRRRRLYHSSSEESSSDSSGDENERRSYLYACDPCLKQEEVLCDANQVPKSQIQNSTNTAQKRKIEDCLDTSLETKLHQAIARKDATAIRAISTNEKSLIDIRNKEGKTALHMAVESCTTEIVQILLKAGANAHVQDQNGFTPLHYAIIMKKKMKAETIIRHDGVNSLKSIHGWTVLHCAARSGHYSIFEYLVSAIRKRNRRRTRTKGILDIDKGDQNLLDIQDNAGNTALHWTASKMWGAAHSKLLLEAGANARLPDKKGYMPVHIAVLNQKEKNAEVFFDHDNGALLKDRNGMNSLHHAAKRGFEGILRILLARAKKFQASHPVTLDSSGTSRILSNKRNIVDVQDSIRWTALHNAANGRSPQIVKMLLTAGANTHQQDERGYTPLHVVRCGSIAETLCDHDGGRCLQDKAGRTPLHYAVKYRRLEVVENLLYCGVHPNVLDNKGKSPLFFSFAEEDEDAEKMTQMIISSICLFDIEMNWEDLNVFQKDLDYCQELMADCKTEIQLMKDTKLQGSTLSYHDVVKNHTSKVAVYLENRAIRNVLFGKNSTHNFPYYSEMISYKVRKAERRKMLNDQCLQCFSMLFEELPFLPKYTIDNILVCLNVHEMENFVDAFKCKV